MKRTSAELKKIAKEKLRGHYGVPMAAMLVGTITVLLSFLPIFINIGANPSISGIIIEKAVTFLMALLSAIFGAGLIRIHLQLAYGRQALFSDLFWGFKRHPGRFLLSGLFTSLISLICYLPYDIFMILSLYMPNIIFSLLSNVFSILGIVVAYYFTIKFALAPTLLIMFDNMNTVKAYRTSTKLMHGNKGRYLYIILSFVGWILLSYLTCGIGLLWLMPYIMQTKVMFYLDVTGKLVSGEAPNNHFPLGGNQ